MLVAVLFSNFEQPGSEQSDSDDVNIESAKEDTEKVCFQKALKKEITGKK